MNQNQKLKDKGTEVSLETAEKWTKRWKDPKEDASRKKVNGYLIPKATIEGVLAQGIDAARAYIGINDEGEQILLFVGTKYDEKTGIYVDMLPSSAEDGVTVGSGEIYDATRPAPPYGDPSSPL